MTDAGRMYIDGAWVDAASGRTREVLDPGDGQPFARVAEGDREDARRAVAAARKAFDVGAWPRTAPAERSAWLSRLADAVVERREELAELETRDTGKTLEESRWDMDDVAGVFRHFAGLVEGAVAPERLHAPSPDGVSELRREPVGVCGLITPWNYPLLQASWKLGPALATGCTMVIKPSEITPLSTVRIVRLCEELGLPGGVLNLVLGPGGTAGAELAESQDVDLLSFTGGVQTGRGIMAAAAGNVKRVALELGGKNPHIVFDDAPLDTAVDAALNGVFFHAGQICSAGSRLMLQAGIHDRFVEALTERMSGIVVGRGLDPRTQMGPLISSAHRSEVERHVAVAVAEGAELRLGGERPTDPSLESGFFYLPTLFTGCEAGMEIVRDEVFGPVITVERFHTEEEALRLANATPYGLSAGFRTSDRARIERLGEGLRFGTVWINDFNVYFAAAPWGGYRQSGIGRELGAMGLDEYLEVKHLYENTAPQALGWFGP